MATDTVGRHCLVLNLLGWRSSVERLIRPFVHPQGEEVDITVKRAGENYTVTVDGVTAGDLEDGSVQFGWFYDVNRSRGAEPRQVTQRGNRTTFVFPTGETGIDTAPGGPEGDVRVRLFAKRNSTGRPVRGTATVEASEGKNNRGGGTERTAAPNE